MSGDRKKASDIINGLFDSWYPNLLRYSCGQLKQRPAAEELVQEVFLDLYKALLDGQTIRFPKAWTMCVLRRKAAARRNDLLNYEEACRALDDQEPFAPSQCAELEMAIDCRRLRSHLMVLSSREEEVLLLRLQAMKCREIAAALGITVSSVNQYLARALEKLQREFLIRGEDRRRDSK